MFNKTKLVCYFTSGKTPAFSLLLPTLLSTQKKESKETNVPLDFLHLLFTVHRLPMQTKLTEN